jgi:putative membrane protein
MKTYNSLKILFHPITIIFFTSLLIYACVENKKAEDTKEIVKEKVEAISENTSIDSDAKFLVDASEMNLEQIQLGKLAQQNGMMSEVKDMGKRMEVSHGKMLKDLSEIASEELITIPTSISNRSMGTYEELSNKTGFDFDKDYCDLMVKDHEDALEMYEKASLAAINQDIKIYADSALPDLRMHLEYSLACKKRCNNI